MSQHFQKLHLRQLHSPELHQGIAVVGEPHGSLSGQRSKTASLRAMDSEPDWLADVRLLFVVAPHNLVVAQDVHNFADARNSASVGAEPRVSVSARTAKLHFASRAVAGWEDRVAALVVYNPAAATAACANKTAAAASMSAIHTTAAIHTTGAAHNCSSGGRFHAWTGFARNCAPADCADQNFAAIHAGSEDSGYGVEQTTARSASTSMPLPSCSKCTCSSPLLPDVLF